MADYQKYLKAHPKPVDSDAGSFFFSELVNSGVEPERIIAAATVYAETVKSWSVEAKVQQSDNFLDPERGQWKKQHPKPKAVRASEEDVLAFHAETVIQKKPAASSTVNSSMARRLLEAELVTIEQLKAAGVEA